MSVVGTVRRENKEWCIRVHGVGPIEIAYVLPNGVRNIFGAYVTWPHLYTDTHTAAAVLIALDHFDSVGN
jgi:hypothetical protein